MDNEPLELRGFQRCLERHAELVLVSTFEEARALLERGMPFDAFVFDIHLDPGSGLYLLAFAREHGYATTPAMLVTGASGNDFVNPAQALRAEPLTKPFPPEQLREFVRRAAERDENSRRPSSFQDDPVSTVRLRSRVSLDDCIGDLRVLLALRQTWDVWYATGAVVNEAKRFGPRAVRNAAAATKQGVVKLHRCARVAARWSASEVKEQLALEMRDGSSISWRHLVALAPIDDDDLRKKVLDEAIEKSLNAPELERLVANARLEVR